MAIDLLHATATGDFPYPGGLRRQPAKLGRWYRTVLVAATSASRLNAMQGMAGAFGAAGGDPDALARPEKPRTPEKPVFYGPSRGKA